MYFSSFSSVGFGGCFVIETPHGPVVDLGNDVSKLAWVQVVEVGAFGHVSSDDAVPVFVASPLPGGVGDRRKRSAFPGTVGADRRRSCAVCGECEFGARLSLIHSICRSMALANPFGRYGLYNSFWLLGIPDVALDLSADHGSRTVESTGDDPRAESLSRQCLDGLSVLDTQIRMR